MPMDDPEDKSNAGETNLEYYLRECPGRADYWRRMAAPRFRVRTFLRLIAQYNPSSLVDLGCGSGELLKEIQKAYPAMRLCGIDLSPALIGQNRKRYPSIAWHAADLGREHGFQPELSNCFDAVAAAEIIEHLEDPLAFLRNARALARPRRGMLFLSTQSGAVRETERRVGHHRHFTAEEMSGLLTAAGWRPLEIWNAGFPFHDLSKWFANLKPDATMKRFSEQEYGAKEKLVCLMLRLAFRLNSGKRGAQLFATAAA